MSTITIPKFSHHQTSYRPAYCPFRERHTSEPRSQSSQSWCAHHTFSDTKSCNLYQPCTTIAAIAKDPSFQIQTALLWIRSNDTIRQQATTSISSYEDDRRVPQIILNDAIQGHSPADSTIHVREDKPDLGLLHLHRDRLAAAAEAFGWGTLEFLKHDDSALSILRQAVEKYLSSLPSPPIGMLEYRKVRILVERTGRITVDSSIISLDQKLGLANLLVCPFMPSSFDEPPVIRTTLCKVALDTQPTRPSTLTTHKTTHRCMYTAARARANITPTTSPTMSEVLLYNPFNELIETSTCTVYLKRDGRWITPAAICGANLGVTRRLAIERGLCRQGTVEKGDLKVGEELWLSNAVRGFFKAVIVEEARVSFEDGIGSERVSTGTREEMKTSTTS